MNNMQKGDYVLQLDRSELIATRVLIEHGVLRDADALLTIQDSERLESLLILLEDIIKQTPETVKKSIHIKWTQQGHSTLDPAGDRTHDLKTLWITCDPDDVEKHEAEAREHAEAQNWITYEVYIQ